MPRLTFNSRTGHHLSVPQMALESRLRGFVFGENSVCPLLVRYSFFLADRHFLCLVFKFLQKSERTVHSLGYTRLRGLEHMTVRI